MQKAAIFIGRYGSEVGACSYVSLSRGLDQTCVTMPGYESDRRAGLGLGISELRPNARRSSWLPGQQLGAFGGLLCCPWNANVVVLRRRHI